ncbi:DUF2059 domain-containing protein [Rheinheimera baltica]|uniref:DUF2059 domain-containing protein n=1 Tax=Rheinheimera baltica TaxID=67576 RepID=A0ABT9I2M6_9GAMM|nr:DUF2059 domain-containing protein [Rheinheimera baltica]MDP5137623.1 DUF2059 domain-containing protein [Rheinheimera baltica]
MKLIKISLILLCLSVSTMSIADPAAEKEAEKLLNIMGMENALQQSMSQMIDIHLQQNQALAPYKDVMMAFFAKHMSYESLKPDMLRIYADAFTAAELRELNNFYATDVGKKTIQQMPTLMAQGAQIGAARVQQNIGELQAMIKAEAERIKALQQQ